MQACLLIETDEGSERSRCIHLAVVSRLHLLPPIDDRSLLYLCGY